MQMQEEMRIGLTARGIDLEIAILNLLFLPVLVVLIVSLTSAVELRSECE